MYIPLSLSLYLYICHSPSLFKYRFHLNYACLLNRIKSDVMRSSDRIDQWRAHK